MKILFFIGSLRTGGKERRLIELLYYLKNNTKYDTFLVLRQNQIEYSAFKKLDIPYIILTKTYKKKDVRLVKNFYAICETFKPDIIHTWGKMPAFVALPTIIIKRIIHVNNQITSAPPNYKQWSFSNLINKINFLFSDVILSNSYAGLKTYNPPAKKSLVIYNGINLSRVENIASKDFIRNKYNIETKFAVIMMASFTNKKNYNEFIKTAEYILNLRDDISFICAGDGPNLKEISLKVKNINKIIFTGLVDNAEDLIHCCDIGILLSNKKVHGEGISNTIMEYMTLSKPVIANDAGGTAEIIKNKINGFLITTENHIEIAKLIIELIDNPNMRASMGLAGRRIIEEKFTSEIMGAKFVSLYNNLIQIK